MVCSNFRCLKIGKSSTQDSDFIFYSNISLDFSYIIFLAAGTANNAGAILVLGRDLVVVPKLIHPLPPALSSPENSPERMEDTWMQVQYFQIFCFDYLLLL